MVSSSASLYAKQHKDVVFMRKDDIAKIVLKEDSPLIDNSESKYNN